MQETKGYKLGFHAVRTARIVAFGFYDAVMGFGDGMTNFVRDVKTGAARARVDTRFQREMAPRLERMKRYQQNNHARLDG